MKKPTFLRVINLKILLQAFQCDPKGVSESYLGYRWKKGLSELFDVTLVTGSSECPFPAIKPSLQWKPRSKYARRLNSAIKLDYFYFNKACLRALHEKVSEYDLLHHVSPVAPRYPVSLSKYSNRFVLGPIAGGLRVPPGFRKEIEGDEELFFRLREFDNIRFRFDKKLKDTYSRADKIIIAGDYILDLLPEKFHSRCIKMLDVGIDTADYCFSGVDYQSEAVNLLYVGRIVPYKGLLYLLKSISILPENIKRHINLNVVGDGGGGAYELKCREFVKGNHLSENVNFLGFLDKKSVKCIYEASHIFCFPSLAEAGGTVVLEAMAKGLPVIAINYGGPGESVSPQSGYLIHPESPGQLVEEICEKILFLYNDRDKLQRLSLGARERAEKEFDWRMRCLKMADIYKSLV